MALEKQLKIDEWLWLKVGVEVQKCKLKGIIYIEGFHFTCLMFDVKQNCVYHDGIKTGSDVYEAGHINEIDDINTYKRRKT